MNNQNFANMLGVRIHILDENRLNMYINSIIENHGHEYILNVNIQAINLSFDNLWLRQYFNTSKVTFCDGAGIILGARILGYQIPKRITYADWMWQLAEHCEAFGFTMFFLGSKPGIAEKAAQRLQERHPNLVIAGTHHGYFDKTPGSLENEAIIQQINAARPNILIVAFGMPLQEKWLMENWERIDANIALTGGAVFDYISGELARAPRWMTDNGLEWLGRLLIEPGRLWKRYVIGNPLFLWRILLQRLGVLRL